MENLVLPTNFIVGVNLSYLVTNIHSCLKVLTSNILSNVPLQMIDLHPYLKVVTGSLHNKFNCVMINPHPYQKALTDGTHPTLTISSTVDWRKNSQKNLLAI